MNINDTNLNDLHFQWIKNSAQVVTLASKSEKFTKEIYNAFNRIQKQLHTFSPDCRLILIQSVIKVIKDNSCHKSVIKYFCNSSFKSIALKLFENIKNYNIKEALDKFNISQNSKYGQIILVELAKIFIEKEDDFSNNIQKFGITSQDDLVEIAGIIALKSPKSLMVNFRNFNIESEAARIKIVYSIIGIEKPPSLMFCLLILTLKKFAISSQDELIKIVEIIAYRDASSLLHQFKEINIESQVAKINIIKLIAKSKSLKYYAIDTLIDKMQKFGIKSQDDFIEIAEHIAIRSPSDLSRKFDKFNIQSESERIRIVKLCIENYEMQPYKSKNYLKVLTENFQKFKIYSQNNLIEIIEGIALKDPQSFREDFQNFKLESEISKEFTIQLAKKSPKVVLDNRDILQITSQEDLLMLMNIMAEYNLEEFSANIHKLGILPKDLLLRFVKLSLENNPHNILTNNNITHDDLLNVVHVNVYKSSIKLKTFNIDKLRKIHTRFTNELTHCLNSLISFWNLFFKILDNNPLSDEVFFDFKNLWIKELKLDSCFVSSFEESYKFCKTEEKKKKFLDWVVSIGMICLVNKNSEILIKNVKSLHSIKKTVPYLKNLLLKDWLDFFDDFDVDKQKKLLELQIACKGSFKTIPVHTEVPIIIFAGYPEEVQDACLEAIKKIRNSRELFREKSNKKILLETILLIKNCALKSINKRALILNLFQYLINEKSSIVTKNFFTACSYVKNLMVLQDLFYFETLENIDENFLNTLDRNLEKILQKLFQINTDKLNDKYQNTIGKWRQSELLITFAAKLNELGDPEYKFDSLEMLKTFVLNVLNNDFRIKRYDTKNNPHLDFIKSVEPNVFEKWQENIFLDSLEMPIEENQNDTPLSDKIKNQMLIGLKNGHLGIRSLYSYIKMYLENTNLLNQCLKNIQTELSFIKENQVDLKQQLLIQQAILEVFSVNDIQEIEKKISTLMLLISSENQFNIIDLSACLNILKNDVSQCQKYFSVVESDDPNDFLLIGTEVEGSCQNVNGDPDYNQCLLGYMNDGKYKSFLIKDAKGRILARTMARLLIDINVKPVLFQEQLYTANKNPQYAILLQKLALKKAQILNIPLFRCEDSYTKKNNESMKYDLFALESSVPLEYVDALNAPVTAPYTISDSYEVKIK